ncbi:hypothetical protein [Litorivicinus lipolyticus]|uniref:hypothetical protein n=1 Tax=Litorivicinus lipolyticus TaxID=418701 RepID=UPI003B5CB866
MVVVSAFSFWASAQGIPAYYRFIDEAGRTQLSDKIPPAQVKRGYEVLDSQLFVIRRVAPELTPAQLAARELERQRQAEIAAQAAKDQQLLMRYPSVADLDMAERNDIERLELQVLIADKTLEIQRTALAQVERQAAREERNGAISDDTLNRVSERSLDVAKLELALAKRHIEINDLRALYAARRARIERLVGQR